MSLTLRTKSGHLLLGRTCREADEAIRSGDVRCFVDGARGAAFCSNERSALVAELRRRCPPGSLAGAGRKGRRRKRRKAKRARPFR